MKSFLTGQTDPRKNLQKVDLIYESATQNED